MQKVIAKINLNAVAHNARLFKERTKTKLCAVVKANAYGHGAEEIAASLAGQADAFAVALVEEGLALRSAACGRDILVFTPPMDGEEGYSLASSGLIASIPDVYTAKRFLAVCKRYCLVGRVHLKVNTGMNRYGRNGGELGKVCKMLASSPFVKVEGIYSHLYDCNRQTAEEQRERFCACLRIAKGYFPHLLAHLSATYGSLLGREFAFDMTRVGLGLYGYSPVPTTLTLQPAMSVWARTGATGTYRFGGAGYGGRRLETGTPLTLLRAGYADGFLRRQDNGTEGWERNANNLCMDGCIRIGKGRRGEYQPLLLDAKKTALETGTIPYEVLCAATRRAEFIYER